MLKKLTLAIALFGAVNAIGQTKTTGYCGSVTIEQQIADRTDISEAEKARLLAEYHAQEEAIGKRADLLYNNRNLKEDEVYVIPVVFHIFHKNGPENISEAQVRDCLRVMNEEFNKENARLSAVIPEFQGIIGDGKIEFRLATRTPQGGCTNGINRYFNANTYYTSQAPIQALKPAYIWPREKYLNCFIVGSIESSGGGRTLGYAQFPGGAANTDGLVMVYDGIGSIAPSNPTNQSVATHEIGHWLGLFHTWGNCAAAGDAAACNCDDGVTDTPNTKGSPSTCNLSEASCGPLANVQNFMDYSFCYAMFTEGQVARMRSVMQTDNARKNLWQPANVTATGTDYPLGSPPSPLCKADFLTNNSGPVCQGNTVQYTDYSYGSVTSWNWTFEGGTPATSTQKNPTVTYATPGTYKTTLVVSDGTNSVDTVKNNFVTVLTGNALGTPYLQTFTSVTSLAPEYSVVNPNSDKTFELNLNVGNGDSRCVYIQNRVVAGLGREDELVSNTIDLTNANNPVLRFNYAYARKNNSSTDELNVYTSTDCGLTWAKRKVLKGTTLRTGADKPTGDYVPTATEWKRTELSLNSTKVQGLRFKLEWINQGGNNVYIDSIMIADASTGIDEAFEANLNLGIYPNPANESSEVSFDLLNSATSTIELFDVLGKKAKTIQNGNLSAGQHKFTINRDNLNTGVYFVKITIDNREVTKKIIFN
ncbi:MAG: M43 family zinc metalloprotease [Bacteroidota bacterium]